MLHDDIDGIGEFDRGGNVFTRIGAASVSLLRCHVCLIVMLHIFRVCLHCFNKWSE